MELVERFRAAPNDRKFWALCWAAVGLAMLGLAVFALCAWVVPWALLAAPLGFAIVVCSAAHELYQQRWGTWGLIAESVVFAGALLVMPALGYGNWSIGHLVGPAMMLAGTVIIWRDRPNDNQLYIVPAQVSRYIARLERDLDRIQPQTPFHAAVGRDLTAQVESAADWLAELHDQAAEELNVTAIFVEMNRFDINTDRWFIDGFAFNLPTGEMFDDLYSCLGEYEFATEDDFALTGMEDLQAAFEREDIGELMVAEDPAGVSRQQAVGAAFDLITARMQELVARAHKQARRRGHPVGNVRVFANAHDTPWPPMCSPA